MSRSDTHFKIVIFVFLILQTFPEKEELLRNMMGLLGNVAEVEVLRPRLMTTQFVTVFSDLLDSYSDGIEVGFLIQYIGLL